MKVKECMCNKVIWVKSDVNVREVAKIMSDEHIGCLPVCDDENKIIGLITDRDLVTRAVAVKKDIDKTKVDEIMTTHVYKIKPDNQVSEASKIMCDCQIKRLPVIENEQIVGIITLGDLANENNVSSDEIGNTVQRICSCDDNPKNSD